MTTECVSLTESERSISGTTEKAIAPIWVTVLLGPAVLHACVAGSHSYSTAEGEVLLTASWV